MERELKVLDIVTNGVTIGLKNFLSILGAIILYVITIWIPYLNVGTTIAMASLPIELSKGNVMNPTAIFDAKYRKYMGDYFILQGLIIMALLPAVLFMLVPALVLGLSWSLAIYLLIDKGLNPTQALAASNKHTYGYKWKIFFGYLILFLLYFIVVGILSYISEFLGGIVVLLLMPILLGVKAYIYKVLVLDVGEIVSDDA